MNYYRTVVLKQDDKCFTCNNEKEKLYSNMYGRKFCKKCFIFSMGFNPENRTKLK